MVVEDKAIVQGLQPRLFVERFNRLCSVCKDYTIRRQKACWGMERKERRSRGSGVLDVVSIYYKFVSLFNQMKHICRPAPRSSCRSEVVGSFK
jgi:hypothetical protein